MSVTATSTPRLRLTDEELFAYTRDLEEAAPFGLWFGRLEEVEQQAAKLRLVLDVARDVWG